MAVLIPRIESAKVRSKSLAYLIWPGSDFCGDRVASYPGRSLINKKRPGNLSEFKLLTSAALQLAVPISRGGQTLHAPIHKGSNLGTGLRKFAGSSVTTYRSSSQPEPDQNSTG